MVACRFSWNYNHWVRGIKWFLLPLYHSLPPLIFPKCHQVFQAFLRSNVCHTLTVTVGMRLLSNSVLTFHRFMLGQENAWGNVSPRNDHSINELLMPTGGIDVMPRKKGGRLWTNYYVPEITKCYHIWLTKLQHPMQKLARDKRIKKKSPSFMQAYSFMLILQHFQCP